MVRPFFGDTTFSIMTFSITINNMERSAYNDIQHDGRVLLCLVLLCWMSHIIHLYWVSLCWMSHIIHLYWVSLCWMSLCWVSWRHFFIISCGKISQLIKKMSISKCLSRKQHFPLFKRQWNVVFFCWRIALAWVRSVIRHFNLSLTFAQQLKPAKFAPL